MGIIKITGNSESNKSPHTIKLTDEYVFSSELHKHETTIEKNQNFYIRKFYTDGLILIDTLAVFKNKMENMLAFENQIVAMIFHNQGHSKMFSKKDNDCDYAVLKENVHNIQIINNNNLHLVFESEDMIDSFIVFLSKYFFLKLMPKENDMNEHLISALKNGISTKLSQKNLPLSQDMRNIINNVRHCTRKGSFHRLCLEIKIVELLMLQLEQFHLLNSEKGMNKVINNFDQEKLAAAKDILDKNYHNPPTIKKLSLMIGMNESKLKSNFKQSFNSTIHAYIVKLRMQMAYQLISGGNLLIKEIAIKVGYQNPSHFSAVFKEFYGFGPSSILTNLDAK